MNDLINFGNLTKPADTLIKKISNAVGVLFEPRQIKRVAEAKAEAAKTEAQSEIEITDLHRRAARRWIGEEAQRQKNMESITAKAWRWCTDPAPSVSHDRPPGHRGDSRCMISI